MKTTPCPQPPSTTEPFDGKPRVIVIEGELMALERERNEFKKLSDDYFDRLSELAAELKTCRESALREAAEISSMFSINKNSIHPDLTYEQLKPEVQLVIHSTCQHVSQAILSARDKKGEL